jgi:hypothetical protein
VAVSGRVGECVVREVEIRSMRMSGHIPARECLRNVKSYELRLWGEALRWRGERG